MYVKWCKSTNGRDKDNIATVRDRESDKINIGRYIFNDDDGKGWRVIMKSK